MHVHVLYLTLYITKCKILFCLISIPAQVDREEGLRHQVLLHHVVKDRHHIVRGNGLEGKSQDTIGLHTGHERSL